MLTGIPLVSFRLLAETGTPVGRLDCLTADPDSRCSCGGLLACRTDGPDWPVAQPHPGRHSHSRSMVRKAETAARRSWIGMSRRHTTPRVIPWLLRAGAISAPGISASKTDRSVSPASSLATRDVWSRVIAHWVIKNNAVLCSV